MFTLKYQGNFLILLLCVDDIVLTGSSSALLEKKKISIISSQFAMKDLRPFLSRFSGGANFFWRAFISTKVCYWFTSINFILIQSNLYEHLVSLEVLPPFLLNPRTYNRTMVNALQYLTMTPPHIAYVVILSQIMHASHTQLHDVKRIFKYLQQGTSYFGLFECTY